MRRGLVPQVTHDLLVVPYNTAKNVLSMTYSQRGMLQVRAELAMQARAYTPGTVYWVHDIVLKLRYSCVHESTIAVLPRWYTKLVLRCLHTSGQTVSGDQGLHQPPGDQLQAGCNLLACLPGLGQLYYCCLPSRPGLQPCGCEVVAHLHQD